MFPLGKLSLQINPINSNNNQQLQNNNNLILPSPSAFFFPQTFEAELVKFDQFDSISNNNLKQEEEEENLNYFLSPQQEEETYSNNHSQSNSLDYSNFSNNSPNSSNHSSPYYSESSLVSTPVESSTTTSSYESLELLDSINTTNSQYSTSKHIATFEENLMNFGSLDSFPLLNGLFQHNLNNGNINNQQQQQQPLQQYSVGQTSYYQTPIQTSNYVQQQQQIPQSQSQSFTRLQVQTELNMLAPEPIYPNQQLQSLLLPSPISISRSTPAPLVPIYQQQQVQPQQAYGGYPAPTSSHPPSFETPQGTYYFIPNAPTPATSAVVAEPRQVAPYVPQQPQHSHSHSHSHPSSRNISVGLESCYEEGEGEERDAEGDFEFDVEVEFKPKIQKKSTTSSTTTTGNGKKGRKGVGTGGTGVVGKRFICPQVECGRAFARNFNMQSHLKSHLGIRDFNCSHCPKKFSRRHDRARHCSAVHNSQDNIDDDELDG